MAKRTVVFRVDASVEMGLGHVMRCNSLANQLEKHGWNILFLCKNHIGHQAEMIKSNGHHVVLLNANKKYKVNYCHDYDAWLGSSPLEDAELTIANIQHIKVELLIVDHYSLDAIWHKKLRPYVQKIMVIDDLANRKYDCDILVDQTFNRIKNDYNSLVNEHTFLCVGSKYALLREQFQLNPEKVLSHRLNRTSLNKILIMLGGSDSNNYTKTLLDSLLKIKGIHLTIILGKNYSYLRALEIYVEKFTNVKLHYNVTDMTTIMLQHDICIGAAGSSNWERCVCGLPSILVLLAANQKKIVTEMVAFGAAQLLSDVGSPSEIQIKLDNWRNELEFYYECVKKNLEICDGQGTNRVVLNILKITESTGTALP